MIFLLEGGTPPGILYEYQNKGFVKFAFRKCMTKKGMKQDTWERPNVETSRPGRDLHSKTAVELRSERRGKKTEGARRGGGGTCGIGGVVVDQSRLMLPGIIYFVKCYLGTSI